MPFASWMHRSQRSKSCLFFLIVVKISHQLRNLPNHLVQQPCLVLVALWEQAVYLLAVLALAPSVALLFAAKVWLFLTGLSAASRCVSYPTQLAFRRAFSADTLEHTIQLLDLGLHLAQT